MAKCFDVRHRSDLLLDGNGDARSPLGAAAGLNEQEAAFVNRVQERVARNLRAQKGKSRGKGSVTDPARTRGPDDLESP